MPWDLQRRDEEYDARFAYAAAAVSSAGADVHVDERSLLRDAVLGRAHRGAVYQSRKRQPEPWAEGRELLERQAATRKEALARG